MAFYKHIQPRHILLLVSLYFMWLGVYDLVTDIFSGNIVWWHALIDVLLCLPLVFRTSRAHIATGGMIAVVFGYLLLALTSDLVRHVNRAREIRTALLNGGLGYLFIGFSFLCAIALVVVSAMSIAKEKKYTM